MFNFFLNNQNNKQDWLHLPLFSYHVPLQNSFINICCVVLFKVSWKFAFPHLQYMKNPFFEYFYFNSFKMKHTEARKKQSLCSSTE